MSRIKRVWSRVNPIHATILGVAVIVLAAGSVLAALGLDEAALAALAALIVIAYYWWGGIFELFDR